MLHFFIIFCLFANVYVAADVLILWKLIPCIVCVGIYTAVDLCSSGMYHIADCYLPTFWDNLSVP